MFEQERAGRGGLVGRPKERSGEAAGGRCGRFRADAAVLILSIIVCRARGVVCRSPLTDDLTTCELMQSVSLVIEVMPCCTPYQPC